MKKRTYNWKMQKKLGDTSLNSYTNDWKFFVRGNGNLDDKGVSDLRNIIYKNHDIKVSNYGSGAGSVSYNVKRVRNWGDRFVALCTGSYYIGEQMNDKVIDAIYKMSEKDLKNLKAHIRCRQDSLAQQTKMSFKPGETCFFTGRRGMLMEGKIERIKQKYILVTIPSTGMKWNVHPSFLKKKATEV